MANYGNPEFWDERYSKDTEPFDWYQRYTGIKVILNRFVRNNAKILMAGCGTSRLSSDMINDGYKEIVNIDISSVVINLMAEKHKGNSALTWKTMSVTNMEFGDATFDAVIDKGTLDAILCGDGSTTNAEKMCSEISRVLKPGGVYVVITYGNPDSRLYHLDKPKYGWKIENLTVEKPKILASSGNSNDVHYIYVCTKDQ